MLEMQGDMPTAAAQVEHRTDRNRGRLECGPDHCRVRRVLRRRRDQRPPGSQFVIQAVLTVSAGHTLRLVARDATTGAVRNSLAAGPRTYCQEDATWRSHPTSAKLPPTSPCPACF